MKKFSKQTIENYCKDPYYCPFCGSDDITVDEHDEGYNKVSCNNCEQAWREIYAITGIELP